MKLLLSRIADILPCWLRPQHSRKASWKKNLRVYEYCQPHVDIQNIMFYLETDCKCGYYQGYRWEEKHNLKRLPKYLKDYCLQNGI